MTQLTTHALCDRASSIVLSLREFVNLHRQNIIIKGILNRCWRGKKYCHVIEICCSSRLDGVCVRLCTLVCTRVYNTVRRRTIFFFFSPHGKVTVVQMFQFCCVAGVMLSLYSDYVTGCTPKISWLDSWQVKDICLLSKISRPAPVKWVSGVSFNGIKRPGSAAHPSSSSNTEVKNDWSYTSYLPYVFMVCIETGSPS